MQNMRLGGEERTSKVRLPDGQEAVIFRKSGGQNDLLEIEVPYQGAYGMGEKFNRLNQRGMHTVNQVVEKFCFQGENTYLPAPFFVTDTGFGLYVETAEKTEFEFGEKISCVVPKGAAVHIWSGSLPDIIGAYRRLFGKAKLPPKYAFGIWISANRWNSQKEVEKQLERLEQHQYPANVMVLEAWSDEATFYIWNGAAYEPAADGAALRKENFDFSKSVFWPDPEKMIQKLHEKGIKLVLWQIPVYKEQDEKETHCIQLELDKKDALSRKLCVYTKEGQPYRIPEGNWFAGSLIPDFTKKETKESWFSKRNYLLDMGVDGFKTDGGEFIYRDDLVFSDHEGEKQAKNRYAQLYTGAYTEFLTDDKVLFSRAGYAGAHTTPIHWGGDQQSVNEELRHVLCAGLSAAMTGISFWCFDIAGFAGPLPTMDYYKRATQLAVFSPVMQWHSEPDGGQFKELMPGMEGNNERSPWNLAEVYGCPEFIEEIRYWHYLRMNLVPYLYASAIACVQEERPMMRPLVYDFYDDKIAAETEDEFLLGNNLLAAPFLEENQKQREVYFPEGEWYGLFSRRKYQGNCFMVSHSEEKMPVYLRCGTATAFRANIRKGLGSQADNQVMSLNDIHFLIAGKEGNDKWQDESHMVFITWKDKEVKVEGAEGLNVTWELIQ